MTEEQTTKRPNEEVDDVPAKRHKAMTSGVVREPVEVWDTMFVSTETLFIMNVGRGVQVYEWTTDENDPLELIYTIDCARGKSSLVVTADEQTLITMPCFESAEDKNVMQAWSLKRDGTFGKLLWSKQLKKRCVAFAVTPDGCYVFVSGLDNRLWFSTADSNTEFERVWTPIVSEYGFSQIVSITVSSDGHYVACGFCCGAIEVFSLKVLGGFSPRLIVQQMITHYRMEDGKSGRESLWEFGARVAKVSFLPKDPNDESLDYFLAVASECKDRHVSLWSFNQSQELKLTHQWSCTTSDVPVDLSVSPDGKYIVTTDSDDHVYVFTADGSIHCTFSAAKAAFVGRSNSLLTVQNGRVSRCTM